MFARPSLPLSLPAGVTILAVGPSRSGKSHLLTELMTVTRFYDDEKSKDDKFDTARPSQSSDKKKEEVHPRRWLVLYVKSASLGDAYVHTIREHEAATGRNMTRQHSEICIRDTLPSDENEVLEWRQKYPFHDIAILFDDCILELPKSVVQIALYNRHHKLNLFFAFQLLFTNASPNLKTLLGNCSGLVVFRSPRSRQSLRIFFRQLAMSNQHFKDICHIFDTLVETGQPYAYLYVALAPYIKSEYLRFRSHLTRGAFQRAYVPHSTLKRLSPLTYEYVTTTTRGPQHHGENERD